MPVTGVVSRNVVSMRSRPDARSEVVSQALWGETVVVLAHAGAHVLVKTPDGYRGWIPEDATVPDIVWRDSCAERLVADLFAPVRMAPETEARQLTVLTMGARVRTPATGHKGAFAEIALPAGGIGFIAGRSLREPPTAGVLPDPDALVRTAMRFVGVPYLWGGRSAFGIDCSGFVQMVYGLHGLTLPRDAYLQAAWTGAVPVEREGLRPGDLVFFGGDHDPRGRGITHVGMALEPPAFIHAAGGIGVTVGSLRDPIYDAMFRRANRPCCGSAREPT